jgi:hypothetical protein
MSNLRRRLTRLEGLLTDRRGLIPYSGACEDTTERIAIAFVDVTLAEAAQDDALRQKSCG